MELAVLMRGAAIILAALGGWMLARITPHWADDRRGEYMPHSGMSMYYGMPEDHTGKYGGCFSNIPAAFSEGGTAMRTAVWVPWLLILGGLVLAFFFWYDGPKAERLDRTNFLVDPSHWIVIGSAIAGYVVSQVLKNIGRKG